MPAPSTECVGLTLDRTVLDQRTAVFAHGQLYTALSRIRSCADNRVLFVNNEDRHSEETEATSSIVTLNTFFTSLSGSCFIRSHRSHFLPPLRLAVTTSYHATPALIVRPGEFIFFSQVRTS
jgi:hypothetical protein